MKTLEEYITEINDIFLEGQKRSPDFDTKYVLEECKNYFYKLCLNGGDLNPCPENDHDDERANLACRLYGHAAFNFIPVRRIFAAEELLLHGWDKFNGVQLESDRKIYKGIMAFRLVELYEKTLKDVGAATRWALLTHADDALVKHFKGMGMDRLRYSFGMSEQALTQFDELIKQNALDTRMQGWSLPNRFADDQLLKFALGYPQHAYIFANPTSVLEFPPNLPYLQTLVDRANDPELKSDEKGESLEYLAAYLFLLIPGFIPRKDVMPKTRDFENDLVVSNLRSSSNLEADVFGRDFLVECKNHKDPIGVPHVGYFLYRMKLTHTKFGVIFAKEGISGGETEIEAAQSLRQLAFHEDGSLCVVIDGKDIEKLLKRETSFRSLLMERVNLLRFGKQKNQRGN